jgi:hypothetical protein
MSPLDEDTFQHLATMAPDALRGWLAHNQPPTGEGRAFWWENITSRALQRVYQATDDAGAERLRYARLAAAVSDEAARQGLVSESDRVIRLASLASFYGRQAGCDIRDLADPDDLACEALSALPVPFSAAVRDSSDWTSRSVAEISKLRTAKNLMNAVAQLLDDVRDPDVRAELGRWLEILARLP